MENFGLAVLGGLMARLVAIALPIYLLNAIFTNYKKVFFQKKEIVLLIIVGISLISFLLKLPLAYLVLTIATLVIGVNNFLVLLKQESFDTSKYSLLGIIVISAHVFISIAITNLIIGGYIGNMSTMVFTMISLALLYIWYSTFCIKLSSKEDILFRINLANAYLYIGFIIKMIN